MALRIACASGAQSIAFVHESCAPSRTSCMPRVESAASISKMMGTCGSQFLTCRNAAGPWPASRFG